MLSLISVAGRSLCVVCPIAIVAHCLWLTHLPRVHHASCPPPGRPRLPGQTQPTLPTPDGWANAGWHRNYTAPGGEFVPATAEVATPNMNELVKTGIELNRQYVYKYCSPTRSALQSGRNPYHVNNINPDPTLHNPQAWYWTPSAGSRPSRGTCTSLSGPISTISTVLSWVCVGMPMCGALPSPVCA